MAQHGYLREYDEGWDRNDYDRDREGSWRGQRDWGDRDRGFMFRDRDQAGERARERFRHDDRQWRGSHRDDWSNRDRGSGSAGLQQRSGENDWERSPRNFRSHQDDHYRSWRDQQMQALDRDYADYCREREQQFHSDFDSWRRNRGQNQQSPQGNSSEEVMELNNPRARATEHDSTASPVADATVGTNNSENTGPGRGTPGPERR